MLQQICENIHNYFIKAAYPGTYSIADGALSLGFLIDGQRFWIVGSALNDGVYTYHANGITDDDDTDAAGLRAETFDGTICAMAVPPAVIALAGEIKSWVEKYGDVMNSPFQSEDVIGVYSYEKMTMSKVGGGNPEIGWQDMFEKRLNPWRKIRL